MTDHSRRRFTINGKDLGYPTLFHNGSSAIVMYVVPTEKAQSIIAESGFNVAEIAPGKTLLNLIFVHYTDTQCGAYEEIAMAFTVKPMGSGFRIPYLSTWVELMQGKVASFTWGLPVSTEAACDCGIAMWGFPKTVEMMSFKHENRHAEFLWGDAAAPIIRLTIPCEGKLSQKAISPPVYTLFEGKPCVSYLTQHYQEVGYYRKQVELQLGDHPLADALRDLGLPKKPLFASWNGRLAFEMSAPQELT